MATKKQALVTSDGALCPCCLKKRWQWDWVRGVHVTANGEECKVGEAEIDGENITVLKCTCGKTLGIQSDEFFSIPEWDKIKWDDDERVVYKRRI